MKRFRRASIDRAAFALYINSMETQNTQSPDFREKLIIGASFERQKAKRIPWRKDFIDRPGVLLTVSGNGEIFFEDAHQKLTAGDLVLYDPLPQHLFAGDPEWNFYWFHLPESILKEYRRTPYNTEVPGVRLAHFEKQAFCRIRLEVQEAYLLALQQPQNWEKLTELLLRVILCRAFNCIDSGLRKMESPLNNALPLLTKFDSKLNTAELARRCGMSRALFFQEFRKQFGCPPKQYRNNLLITKAKGMLCSTDLQIQEIAEKLDFQDSFYFCRFFQAQTGQTPSVFRELHRWKRSWRNR